MKIVHIVLGKANPNRMNGVNKIAHKLASTQVAQGHDVTIVGLTNTPDSEKIEREYDLKLFLRKRWRLEKKLVEYLRELGGDCICHFHGGFIIDFYFISKLLAKLNIRYIVTSHGCYNKRAMAKRYFLKRIYFELFDKFLLKNAWRVIFSGHIEFGDIDTVIKGINKKIVHNGQDLKDLAHEYKNIRNTPEKPVFGFVGRVDNYHKGLDKLFDGFGRYKDRGGAGVLWIVGDGEDRSSLVEFSQEHNFSNDVVFWGAKFGNEKYNIIANMDVFVHTSRFEGFPMAVLEAAGLGRPLLLSRGTNFGGYVDKFDCGIVLDENTPEQIEEALFSFEKIRDEGKITLLSNNSLNMIRTDFSWENICDQLIS